MPLPILAEEAEVSHHAAASEQPTTGNADERQAKPGVETVDFELWSLATPAINGCGIRMATPEKTLLRHGVSKDAVQAAVRIATVVHATAATLNGEAALGA